MTRDEIKRFRIELARLRRRRANVKRDELEQLALSMGWTSRPGTGGEPRYEKAGRYPLFIPRHRTLNKFTVGGILRQLEADLDRKGEEANGGRQ